MNAVTVASSLSLLLLSACAGAPAPGAASGSAVQPSSTPVAGPTVVATVFLGPLTGEGAQLHPDNVSPRRIEFYGTDLGWSYEHRGQLQFLFGDSWATEHYAPIEASTGSRFDDSFGTIDLREWRDPSRISATSIPLIRLGQNPGTTEASAIDPGHAMDLGKTPMGGFSSGTREFAIFNLTKPLACARDADCGESLACDTSLGYMGSPASSEELLTLGCRDGTPGCRPETIVDASGAPVAGSGFCVDPTSPMRGERVSNLLSAMGYEVRVGLRDEVTPKKYVDAHDWLTNRFMNVTVRTVQAFDPADGARQDYSVATASGAKRRVFLWGRPGFVGVAANGRSLPLYFAWVDMPAGPGYAWQPNYYTGTVDGRPRFSTRQTDAAPLDLDSTRAGVQPEEVVDIVNQMSVAWIAPLRKWIMFYGGGLSTLPTKALPDCGVLQLFSGAECRDVVKGNGAVRMRTADAPWGPWTPPQDVIVGGDPAAGAVGQYGPGGALRHPACTQPSCAPHSEMFAYDAGEYGFFYGANIIEQWVKATDNGVDIVWNASTWDPYRVVLLRTRLRR